MFVIQNSISIPFRSLTASLFITIINASVELAFLSAMLVMIAANECRKLRKGEAIHIQTHLFSVRLATALAMIMFLAIETLLSINSKEGHRIVTTYTACFKTREGVVSKFNSSASAAITGNCTKMTEDGFSIRTGTLNKSTWTVQCDGNLAYSYTPKRIVRNESLSEAVIKCISATCVAVKSRDHILLISTPSKANSNDVETSNTSFMPTNVTFDPKPILEDISDRVAELYQLGVTDEAQIRRMVLVRAIDGNCEVRTKTDQTTEMDTWIAGLTLAVWILSILLVFAALFIRRRVFFDINRMRDWAAKIHNVPGRGINSEFYIKADLDDDLSRVYVVDSLTKDNLSSLETSLESEEFGEMYNGVHRL